jgi:4-amino-4-deoxy-L-arabinose transferase-like glycosyltransferase
VTDAGTPLKLFARGPVLAIAALMLVALVAGSWGYGYHRDELYFVEAAKHPAFGYPDQPPLTPLLGWLSTTVLGESTAALRVFSELEMAAAVVIAALIARELGGGWVSTRDTSSARRRSTCSPGWSSSGWWCD